MKAFLFFFKNNNDVVESSFTAFSSPCAKVSTCHIVIKQQNIGTSRWSSLFEISLPSTTPFTALKPGTQLNYLLWWLLIDSKEKTLHLIWLSLNHQCSALVVRTVGMCPLKEKEVLPTKDYRLGTILSGKENSLTEKAAQGPSSWAQTTCTTPD